MTYGAIEAEFLDCVDKGLITITSDNDGITYYRCTHSCRVSSNRPTCPLSDHDDRWCKHDGKYSRELLSICHKKYPELFI